MYATKGNSNFLFMTLKHQLFITVTSHWVLLKCYFFGMLSSYKKGLVQMYLERIDSTTP